ncbi:MAG: four helix bundle protein [Armatimonadota bacterium]
MEKPKYASSYRDLTVYKKARTVSKSIFRITKSFPKEEMYSLTDQVRRSSRAVGALIAEAWGKRRYERHFISKLTDADAEQLETQHWIDTAFDCDYLTEETVSTLNDALSEVGRMLNAMMEKADRFCSNANGYLREAPAEYLAITEDPYDDAE